MTWLRDAGRQASGAGALPGGEVLAGAWCRAGRGERRVNAVLTAVRGLVTHAVTCGQALGDLVALPYEVADERDLPEHGPR